MPPSLYVLHEPSLKVVRLCQALSGHRGLSDCRGELLKVVLDLFPHVSAPALIALPIPEPVLESRPVELDIAELPSADEIQAELIAALLAPPIEEWMAFLHPDQAKLVHRSFNGPSRIGGAADTGKTVVGLHSAAYLARSRPGKVLVTTFVKSFPRVLRALTERMAQRARGFEFKQVLLPWTDAALLAPRETGDADAASRDERAERERRVLYVG